MGEQWQHALGLLAVMQQSGLAPDVITYNAALTACQGTWAFGCDAAVSNGSRHLGFWL
jgi:hypothetical protein